ncbi:asaB [Symbiodinium sp. CCMP2456]|nr:asaB [Symbiodinium sp. CCMP2456]
MNCAIAKATRTLLCSACGSRSFAATRLWQEGRIKCSDGVDAQISYLQAPGHGARPYLAMGAAGASSPGVGEPVQYAPQARFICDARREQPSLDREGAVLRRQETALRQQDFYDEQRIIDAYYKEICEVVKSATGADQVIAFHHIVRNERLALQLADGDASKLSGFDNGSGGVGGYARNAHADYTTATAVGAARQALCSVDDEEIVKRCAGSRFALVNAWRSISDSSPVVTHPLALLDATTVCEDDVVLVDLLYPGFVSESLQITFSPKHRWLYWPCMVKDEVVLFKQYDSDRRRAQHAFHCAFEESALGPARESIEVRTVAFFCAEPATEDLLQRGKSLGAEEVRP